MSFLSSPVKSIQRRSITIAGLSSSNTDLITVVDLTSSVINFLGARSAGTALKSVQTVARAELTNSTTITAYHLPLTVDTDSTTVSLEIVEFFPFMVKLTQRGFIALPIASGTISKVITSVNIAKSLVFFSGTEVTDGGTEYRSPGDDAIALELVDSTHLVATRNAAAFHALKVGYSVVEFK